VVFAGFQVPDKLSQMVRYGAMLRLPFDYACFDYAQHEQHKPDAPNAPYTTTGKGLLMPDLRFEWDTGKAQTNLKKHGVSFEEARSVFYDEDALQFYDPDHSADEDHFIMLGLSFAAKVLVVCHCWRESETVIRIISARTADKGEEQDYWRARK